MRIALALLLAIAPSAAFAHDGTGLASGFVAGFSHPLSGFDHMLAMISVGLWGAFLGRPLVVALPIAFPVAMAVGGGLGVAGTPFLPVELGIAASVLVLGTMILFAVRAKVIVAGAIVAIFALFHGYAHGTELPSSADPIGYTTGFVLCTGMLHVAGIGLGLLKTVPWGLVLLRVAGGAIASIGLWFMALAVTT